MCSPTSPSDAHNFTRLLVRSGGVERARGRAASPSARWRSKPIARHGAARPAGGAARQSGVARDGARSFPASPTRSRRMRDARTNRGFAQAPIGSCWPPARRCRPARPFVSAPAAPITRWSSNRLGSAAGSQAESQYVTISAFFSARLDPGHRDLQRRRSASGALFQPAGARHRSDAHRHHLRARTPEPRSARTT